MNVKKVKYFPQYWLNSLDKFLDVDFISKGILGTHTMPSTP